MNHQAEQPEFRQAGDDPVASAELVSALMDGVLSGPEVEAALAAAAQPDGQARWQVYHLIGDAMRDSDLALHQTPALLANVRAAMRAAPMTLAEQPATLPAQFPAPERAAANDGLFRWKLASGFASVVAVLAIGWNLWGGASTAAPDRHEPQLAQARRQAAAQPLVVASVAPTVLVAGDGAVTDHASPEALADDGNGDGNQGMLRDPQLDRLLIEHRQMTTFGRPSAFLRNATFVQDPAR